MANPNPSTFPLFAALPKELRLHIWTLTLPPQLFRIGLGSRAKTRVSDWSASKNPTALLICHESRAAALAHLTLPVPIYQFHPFSNLRFARRFLSADSDIVFLDCQFGAVGDAAWGSVNADYRAVMSLLKVLEPADDPRRMPGLKHSIRRVALPARWWLSRWALHGPDVDAGASGFFYRLREIFIVPSPSDDTDRNSSSNNALVPQYSPSPALTPTGEESDYVDETLMPSRAREILLGLGYKIKTIRDGLEILKPLAGGITHVRHCPPELLNMIESLPRKPSPDDSFLKLDPDVVYRDGRPCTDPPPRGKPAALMRHGRRGG
ncbi:hypothetical protein GGR51DRAFT_236197 [Nemania sp. FL0031]|nr:hypothetical protein GGR51DRAFT_236197 [Nemania sp. FL0031]